MLLDGVSKRYGRGPWVLRDLTLEVSGLVVLTGANGTGKSTLLKIAAGVLRPTSGRVVRPASVGYVPERFPSDVQDVRFVLLGAHGADSAAAANDVLERLGFVGSLTAPMAGAVQGQRAEGRAGAGVPGHRRAGARRTVDRPRPGGRGGTGGVVAGTDGGDSDHEGHLAGGDSGGSRGRPCDDRAQPGGGAGRAGVVGGRAIRPSRGSSARVVVAPDRSDQVLAEALRLGCSVRSVR